MEKCPCQSGLPFKKCCRRLLSGKAKAASPLELMRSRYSAYATGSVDYLIKTTVPDRRGELDRTELKAWCDASRWDSLEIVSHTVDGEQGSVEFIARYRYEGTEARHHEFSTFKQIDGVWYYDTGTFIKPESEQA